jgi:hypothetical protein
VASLRIVAAMISREIEAQILRLHHAEHWPIGTLARQLHVHHATVRRVLAQAGIACGRDRARPSMIDAYVSFIQDTLTRYPTLRASRLYQMARERGYAGGPDQLQRRRASFRARSHSTHLWLRSDEVAPATSRSSRADGGSL